MPGKRAATVYVKAEGDIDLHTVEHLRSRLLDVVAANPAATVIVEAGDVTYIDSTGVGMLVHVRKQAQSAGGDVRLEDASGRVLRILQVSGMDRYFAGDPEPPE